MRLEWKVFISSKPCRLIVVPRQEFIKHMFGKLLFFFVFPKLGISYKAKNYLVYHYAVMRCRESQFLALDPGDIIAYRKRDFQIDVLVNNGKEAQRI